MTPTSPGPAKPPAPPLPPRPSLKDRLVRGSILIFGALFLLAMTYFSGQRANVGVAKRADREKTAAIKQLTDERRKMAERDDTISHLEARRQLHLALLAVDARNFGTAQQHLDGAATQLNTPGAAAGDLAALRQQIDGMNVVAAGDMESQRQQVLGFVQRFDQLVPPAAPSSGAGR